MIKKVLRFIELRWFFIVFSIVMLSAGVVGYLVNGGFNLSIDFTSGLTQQLRIELTGVKASIAEVRQALASLGRFDLQVVGDPQDQEFVVKVLASQADSEFQNRTEAQILELLSARFGGSNITLQESNFVGPRYSRALFTQTIWILLVAIILILIYAAFRFQFVYGMAAVLCLIHDALFMLAVIALFRIEFTTTMVAAVLTIIGYSINDTIVIFDRVRENRTILREADLAVILNTSISQTLGRTILTSLTTLLAVLALFVLARGDIRNFALLMMIGIVEGAYSTIFIASPIAYMWTQANERRRRRRELAKYGRVLEAAAPAHERREPAAAPLAQAEPAPEAGQPQPEFIPQGPGPFPLAPEFVEQPAEAAEGQARPAAPQAPTPVPPGAQPSSPPAGAGAPGYIRVQPVRRHKKRRR